MSYNELVSELKKSSRGNGYSKSDLNTLATYLANDVTASIPVYIKKGNTFVVREMNPARALRTHVLAPALKEFGVDRAELENLDNIKISRAGGEALADYCLLLVKEYISITRGLGRKLTLPMTSPTETVQSISEVSVPEETRETNAIVRTGDVYTPVPTGNTTTTAKHEKLRVANRVPEWLKKTQKSEGARALAA